MGIMGRDETFSKQGYAKQEISLNVINTPVVLFCGLPYS